ncbi:MAG: metallophosphoesterase [Bdellovibrio sp.]|nr:metallophosphoesterase [Bdellovibrio sp.]
MFRSLFLGFVSVGLLVGCATQKVSTSTEGLTYVGLADAQNSFVRTIHPVGGRCDVVRVKRANAVTDFGLPMNEKKFDDAVICEANLPENTVEVQSSISHIVIPEKPKRIVIMGDTGCRLKGNYVQNCNDEMEWPFARVVRSVEKENADLIIHVGDYHYRETCTDPAKCAPFMGNLGYGYKPWEADFFGPAASLLKVKPWIFVRGNHEDCKRAHEGFSKMLTPLGEEVCPVAQDTRYTSMGGILFVNFDNASFDDRPMDAKSTDVKEVRERWKKMVETIKSRPEKEVWLLTHRPIWGLAPIWNGPAGVVSVNANMQMIAKEIPLPKKVKLVFAGHIHNFQISTAGDHPTHVVVGESGTALDYYNDETRKMIPAGYNVFPSDHGYLVMEKDRSEKWVGVIKSYDGKTDFTCALEDPGVPCVDSGNRK